MTTIFQQIIDGSAPCDKIYEDDVCIAIHDIHPRAPVHILVIPKKPIPSLAHVSEEDSALLGHLLWVVHQLAIKLQLATGYRVIINTGPDALQSVFHLHLHILGGRGFADPPG